MGRNPSAVLDPARQTRLDKQLVDSWKAFTLMALSILEDGIRTGLWKVRYSGRQSFKLHDDGGIDSNVVAEHDMGGLVHEGRDELSKIPQYNTLVHSMYGAPMVARHLGKPLRTIQGGGGPYSDWDYAIFPIIRQFRRAASPFVFDEAVFEKSLSELEGFFDSDTVVLLYVAPLYNFNSEIEEELKLQDDLKIRRTTENEMEGLMSKHSFYGPFPFFKVPRLKFSIELRVDSPKVLGEETPTVTPNPIENFDKLVTALRLFQSGDVAIDIVSTSPEIAEVPGLQESSVHRESYLPTGHP